MAEIKTLEVPMKSGYAPSQQMEASIWKGFGIGLLLCIPIVSLIVFIDLVKDTIENHKFLKGLGIFILGKIPVINGLAYLIIANLADVKYGKNGMIGVGIILGLLWLLEMCLFLGS